MNPTEKQLEILENRLSNLENTVSKLIRANQQIPKYVDAFKEKVYTTDEKLEELFITNEKIPEYVLAFQEKISELEKDIATLKASKTNESPSKNLTLQTAQAVLHAENPSSNTEHPTIEKTPLPHRNTNAKQPSKENLTPKHTSYIAPPVESPVYNSSQTQSDKETEVEIGARWSNRIGMVFLILAAAYFLKYTFDNNLIGPMMRIIIGFILGGGLIALGFWFDKKYPILSSGFIGGGSCILYFSTYAAYSFYAFLGQGLAFVIFTIISLGTAYIANTKDSQAIMHLGTIVAFLTPFILATDTPNDFGFLFYIIILNLGVLLLSFFKQWKSVFYVSFFATHICYLVWLVNRFIYLEGGLEQTNTVLGFVSLILIYAEFQIVSLLYLRHGNQHKYALELDFIDLILLYLNATLLFLEGYYIINTVTDDLLGLFAVGCSILYFMMFYLLRFHWSSNTKTSFSTLAIAVGFLTIAIPVQLDGNIISVAWSCQALLLIYFSQKFSIKEFEIISVFILSLGVLSITKALLLQDFHNTLPAFFSLDALLIVLSIIMAILASSFLRPSYQTFSMVVYIIANVFLIAFFLVEISKLPINTNAKALLNSLILLLYSIILMGVGFRKNLQYFRISALVIMGFVIFKVFLFDLSDLSGIYRIVSFMCLGLILIGTSYLYQKYKEILIGTASTNSEKSDS